MIRIRREARVSPLSFLKYEIFTYFRIVVVASINAPRIEVPANTRGHVQTSYKVISVAIRDIEDCQYQDKRYRMDLDGASRESYFPDVSSAQPSRFMTFCTLAMH